jgi:hypothetical protein
MYACILCLETYSAFIHPFWESPHVEQSFKVMTVKDRKREVLVQMFTGSILSSSRYTKPGYTTTAFYV